MRLITMAILTGENGQYRAFVCDPLNEWGYPAKDRSGRLETLEEPHLGKLIAKMGSGKPQSERPLEFVDPKTQNMEMKGALKMLNLNNTPVDESTREFELIPHGTVVRAIHLTKTRRHGRSLSLVEVTGLNKSVEYWSKVGSVRTNCVRWAI